MIKPMEAVSFRQVPKQPGFLYQVKWENRQSINCVIKSYSWRKGRVNSRLLGLFHQEQLIYLGRAGSGLGESQKDLLTQFLPDLAIPQFDV